MELQHLPHSAEARLSESLHFGYSSSDKACDRIKQHALSSAARLNTASRQCRGTPETSPTLQETSPTLQSVQHASTVVVLVRIGTMTQPRERAIVTAWTDLMLRRSTGCGTGIGPTKHKQVPNKVIFAAASMSHQKRVKIGRYASAARTFVGFPVRQFARARSSETKLK